MKRWYALYTRSRHEKRVSAELEQREKQSKVVAKKTDETKKKNTRKGDDEIDY